MSSKVDRTVIPKIKFTRDEDERLTNIIEKIGTQDWELIAHEMKNRTPRQCRERWINYISPGLSNGPWTADEDKLLDELYTEFGSRWHKIAEYFPNRSGNCIKNRYKLRQSHAQKQPSVEAVSSVKPIIDQPLYSEFDEKVLQTIISPPTDTFIDLFKFDKNTIDEIFAMEL